MRRTNGYRTYSDVDVHALRFIHRARSLGFSVEDVSGLVALWGDTHRASADVRALALRHFEKIEEKIRSLEAIRRTLKDLVERCPGDDRLQCPIIDDLAGRKEEQQMGKRWLFITDLGRSWRQLTGIAVAVVASALIAGCDRQSSSPAEQDTGGVTFEDEPEQNTNQTRAASSAPKKVAARWYMPEHAERGAVVFKEHCTACHGQEAEGAPNWRRRGADDKYPPPPLNGTAHTWHHPLAALYQQIKYGAPGGTGAMPVFEDKLSDEEIAAVIAWFQSKWPDEIYTAWFEINERTSENKQ